VTAPPDVITRVQTYLDGQNARLNKQVSVSVQVLDVEITDGDQYGLNLTAAFKDASTFGLGVVSPATTVASTAGGLTYSVLGGKFANTSAIVQALSTTGRVTVRTTASVTTLNGVPAPLQVANTRGYVASITIVPATSTGTGTSTSNQETLNTATVTTGFSLSVLPRIDESGQGLLMQFGVNISDLEGANNGFDNFTTPDGTETVQLPDINSRNFVQQAYIPNGATLVMTGFEQANDTANKSGVGNAGFLGLGGSQVGTHTRDIVVILMTPVILDAGAPIVSVDGE
jgi:type IVB pilus formation R64 PilN family outer membrane protein